MIASDNPSMAFLVVVTGPPGAGKSTVAHALADSFERSVLVVGDAFFEFLARGAIAPWLPAAHGQNEVVIRAAAAATGRFASGGFITIYDGVLGPWFLADFTAEAALDHLHYVILLPSVERCVDQVANRVGHGFTDEEATRHMHRQFAQADIDQRHVLADLPASPTETAAEIARRVQAGTLRYP
jgi:predicted ABC-type ATPase